MRCDPPEAPCTSIDDGERPGGALEQAADTVKTVSPLRHSLEQQERTKGGAGAEAARAGMSIVSRLGV